MILLHAFFLLYYFDKSYNYLVKAQGRYCSKVYLCLAETMGLFNGAGEESFNSRYDFQCNDNRPT